MSVNLNTEKLPQIIFLYGPAGSGKGTQAAKLLEVIKDSHKQLDYGAELRAFVAENKDNPNDLGERARRMSEKMEVGTPVSLEDLNFVVEVKILEKLERGEKILIDGAWRSIAEAEWLSDFLSRNEIDSCILHIFLSLETALARVKERWLIPGSSKPYRSYEEAKADSPEGEEPYQRSDDAKEEVVKERYRKMYGDYFADVLTTYQIATHSPVFMVDGAGSIDGVFEKIVKILDGYYR